MHFFDGERANGQAEKEETQNKEDAGGEPAEAERSGPRNSPGSVVEVQDPAQPFDQEIGSGRTRQLTCRSRGPSRHLEQRRGQGLRRVVLREGVAVGDKFRLLPEFLEEGPCRREKKEKLGEEGKDQPAEGIPPPQMLVFVSEDGLEFLIGQAFDQARGEKDMR